MITNFIELTKKDAHEQFISMHESSNHSSQKTYSVFKITLSQAQKKPNYT